MGYRVPDEKIEAKAKDLNVQILEKYGKNGHTYLKIKCLTHTDKPEREVELYNFLNRDKTCGCMLREYTIDDLKNNPNVRPDLVIEGEYINNSTPIECRCKICNNTWYPTPNKLTQGRGCPLCYSTKLSSGERYLVKIFNLNDIKFEAQRAFEKCKNPITNRLLKFDFYLPDYNLCIEFQGKQHYEAVIFRNGSKRLKNANTKEEREIIKKEKEEKAQKDLASNQYRDNIKREFCKNNNVDLLEIPYYEQKNILQILSDKLKIQLKDAP